ncbi:uncharacterized protein BYT42DRAFT_615075 [Radiomyces spectabilis]|uniref:uncharacterized protein n=1 Tax=Radiomyces spectabilis TaxID=64574 RepID=UPI00221F21B7|nr:uncharacterized protein BYT42DRAFT_615075 [Radiomyces spectabilis]KAI8376309.1 hypothetical protein BYT42DRAFT_615075 [Radiomyces spectabilis]
MAPYINIHIHELSGLESTSDNIKIIPSFAFKLEWLHLLAIALYASGLSSLRSNKHVHWCFLPLIALISFQVSRATWALLDKDMYVQDQLNQSWQQAYDQSSVLSHLESEWHCQGFLSPSDRSMLTSSSYDHPCFPKLAKAFAEPIYRWGIALWALKFIQVIGLLICYSFYLHLDDTMMDDKERCVTEDDNNEQQSSVAIFTNSETICEKLIAVDTPEDATSHLCNARRSNIIVVI